MTKRHIRIRFKPDLAREAGERLTEMRERTNRCMRCQHLTSNFCAAWCQEIPSRSRSTEVQLNPSPDWRVVCRNCGKCGKSCCSGPRGARPTGSVAEHDGSRDRAGIAPRAPVDDNAIPLAPVLGYSNTSSSGCAARDIGVKARQPVAFSCFLIAGIRPVGSMSLPCATMLWACAR